MEKVGAYALACINTVTGMLNSLILHKNSYEAIASIVN